MNKLLAEAIGTFWLVFGGCGSAVLAAMFIAKSDGVPHNIGIGLVGVSLAFGLTVMTMAYAIGHISGCHLNPAVSVGLCVAGRFEAKNLAPYIVSQVAGGLLGAVVLYVIASGNSSFQAVEPSNAAKAGYFATNGYDTLSPGVYPLLPAFLTEFVLTFMFLLIILGSTDKKAPAGFAPIAIGLGLTLIHLIGIPVTNLSVNPARSTGPAVVTRHVEHIQQLWLFWLAPIAGAVAAGVVYPILSGKPDETPKDEPKPVA
jgi:aquaporin Z